MIPVPDHAEGTQYGERGTRWSCDRNAAGEGIHTGVDFPADVGTPVVAARPGTAVYASHGAPFGNHQLEIRVDASAGGGRDFYAHMTARTVADGARVRAGQQVGRVGEEGNVTGPHLHFERHKVATGPWSCAVVINPRPSVAWQPPNPDPNNEEFTMGYADWPQKDKTALVADVSKAVAAAVTESVLDADMNTREPAGSPLFKGVTLRDAVKAIYRKVGAGK